MRERARPLLCELHAHTTWSDGELSLAAVVGLYGTAGFDVLCVTDHVLRRDDPWPLRHGRPCVDSTNAGDYLAEIERERSRARFWPRTRTTTGRRCPLVPCKQDEGALVDHLRSSRPVFLTRLESPVAALAA